LIQQVPIRAYKIKPMTPETQSKVERSRTESLDLSERPLYCPHCHHYVASLFSDASGHFKIKCPNCKTTTPYNMGYFRKRRSRRARR